MAQLTTAERHILDLALVDLRSGLSYVDQAVNAIDQVTSQLLLTLIIYQEFVTRILASLAATF